MCVHIYFDIHVRVNIRVYAYIYIYIYLSQKCEKCIRSSGGTSPAPPSPPHIVIANGFRPLAVGLGVGLSGVHACFLLGVSRFRIVEGLGLFGFYGSLGFRFVFKA